MTPLLLPLSTLPGPAPVGAPVALSERRGMPTRLYLGFSKGLHWALVDGDVTGWGEAWLDLSPPTLTDGWPDRIDGLTVAVVMLARAMGHPPGPVTWMCAGGVQWRLETHALCVEPNVPRVSLFQRRSCYTWDNSTDGRARTAALPGVPALPDDQAPNADRLALIAIFVARPWETK